MPTLAPARPGRNAIRQSRRAPEPYASQLDDDPTKGICQQSQSDPCAKNAEQVHRLSAALNGAGVKRSVHREAIAHLWCHFRGAPTGEATYAQLSASSGRPVSWFKRNMPGLFDELAGFPLVCQLERGQRTGDDATPSKFDLSLLRAFVERLDRECPAPAHRNALVPAGRRVAETFGRTPEATTTTPRAGLDSVAYGRRSVSYLSSSTHLAESETGDRDAGRRVVLDHLREVRRLADALGIAPDDLASALGIERQGSKVRPWEPTDDDDPDDTTKVAKCDSGETETATASLGVAHEPLVSVSVGSCVSSSSPIQSEAKEPTHTHTSDDPDAELLDRARAARNGRKFAGLMDGRTDGYRDRTGALLGLLRMLVYWTDNDGDRAARIARRSTLTRGVELSELRDRLTTMGARFAPTRGGYPTHGPGRSDATTVNSAPKDYLDSDVPARVPADAEILVNAVTGEIAYYDRDHNLIRTGAYSTPVVERLREAERAAGELAGALTGSTFDELAEQIAGAVTRHVGDARDQWRFARGHAQAFAKETARDDWQQLALAAHHLWSERATAPRPTEH